MDLTRGGGNKDTLGSGKGKREQAPEKEVEDSDDPSASLDEDAMETSETLDGTRERAPVEGVMDTDTPTQSIDERSRLGDLHPASVTDKEVAKERAQWWQPEMKENIGTRTPMDTGAPLTADGWGAVVVCVCCGGVRPDFGAGFDGR